MKRFLLAAVLSISVCAWQVVAVGQENPVPEKAPVVTRDNFVSFHFETTSNAAGEGERYSSEYTVEGNIISNRYIKYSTKIDYAGLVGWRHYDPWLRTSVLSNNQLNTLIAALNEANLPSLAGKYGAEDRTATRSESLKVTISDEKNSDRIFVVQNRGDSAPSAYSKLTSTLSLLLGEKFPGWGSGGNAKRPFEISSATLVSLKLETSGGIAGGRSVLAIEKDKLKRMSRDFCMTSINTVGGRGEARTVELSGIELRELFQVLTDADIVDIAGTYNQPSLADGYHELLTLMLQDGSIFTVSNYGDRAPAGYYAITKYLREFQQKKFPEN